MEEVRENALAYYEAGSVELKQLAKTVFNNMDLNGDGKINIIEFADFLIRNNYTYEHKALFKKLDRDGNGFLAFGEVIVFLYIAKTKHVQCDGCGSLILGCTYFVCTDCFYKTSRGYDLCRDCYRSRKYEAGHGPFLDNFAMLNLVRTSIVQTPQINRDVKDYLSQKYVEGYTREVSSATANSGGCTIM